jgi:hypothetical protein
MAIGRLCTDAKKSTAERLDPAAFRTAGAPPRVGIAMDQDADLADGNFPATLLAMAVQAEDATARHRDVCIARLSALAASRFDEC